jgi:hypothetical protein
MIVVVADWLMNLISMRYINVYFLIIHILIIVGMELEN